MKKLLILLLYLCVTICLYAQISIQHKGSLKDLISVLQNKYGYKFMYSNSDINDQQKISINAKNSSLENILKEISKNTGITYKIINKQIVLKQGKKIAATPSKNGKNRTENISLPIKPEIKTEDTSQPQASELPLNPITEIAPTPDKELVEPQTELTLNTQPTVIVDTNTATNDKQTVEQTTKSPPDSQKEKEAKTSEPVKISSSGKLTLHTNLLLDLALTPNLGVEYKLNETLAILANGFWTHINWDNGNKTYRLWAVSAEVRCYLTQSKRIYSGVVLQTGELNLKLNETGRQGDFIGAGVTFGYLVPLNNVFKLDFGIGLSYTRYKHDTYKFIEGVNIRSGSEVKNLWIPVKAGVNLVWTIK